jgi:hypothetical protein
MNGTFCVCAMHNKLGWLTRQLKTGPEVSTLKVRHTFIYWKPLCVKDGVSSISCAAIFSPQRLQGCQMAHFQSKNPNLGKFWRFLQWKILLYFMAIWFILLPFGIFCGHFGIVYGYLANFSRFGMLHQEKSGNPGTE